MIENKDENSKVVFEMKAKKKGKRKDGETTKIASNLIMKNKQWNTATES